MNTPWGPTLTPHVPVTMTAGDFNSTKKNGPHEETKEMKKKKLLKQNKKTWTVLINVINPEQNNSY